MAEENKENLSQVLADRESYKTTVNNFKKTIADLQSDNVILLDDVANKDSELLITKRELDSEKARRIRAENLINEGKKLDSTKSYEETKKELFEDRFTKKWDKANGRK